MVIPACFRAADTAGLTTTSVLLPMTVARPARYLEVAGGLGGVLLVAAGLPAEVGLAAPAAGAGLARGGLPAPGPPGAEPLAPEPLLQAPTASPAAMSTAITGCRELLRSRPISLLPQLVGRKRVEVACHVALVQRVADDGGTAPDRACGGEGEQ